MVILSSPSGAGKTTLVKLLSERKGFVTSISHTTRKPRPNENQNEDYFFVNEFEFKRLIKNEEFLEYAKPTKAIIAINCNKTLNCINLFEYFLLVSPPLNKVPIPRISPTPTASNKAIDKTLSNIPEIIIVL